MAEHVTIGFDWLVEALHAKLTTPPRQTIAKPLSLLAMFQV